MAHNLFHDTMAYVRAIPEEPPPWHGLGKKVPQSVTAKEMAVAANLDWEVRKEPAPGAKPVKPGSDSYDRYLICRDPIDPETGPVALGMVKGTYEPVQNSEAFAFFEPFIEQKWATFNTAGALGNGERIWVMARLDGDIVIGKNDLVHRYLLLSNSHDGSSSVSVRFTPIRVVCQNTLNLAKRDGSRIHSIRHTRHVHDRLRVAQAEQLKDIADHVFEKAEKRFRAMADRRLEPSETIRYLDAVLPRTDLQRKKGDIQTKRWAHVWGILEDKRVTPQDSKETLWALYNAVVRDEDYRLSPKVTAESRLTRVWFGCGRDLKLRALDAAKALLN